MRNVLIITNDHIGDRRAGPAIRAWEMATVLSREHHVILTSLTKPAAYSNDFEVAHIDEQSISRFSDWAGIIIIHPTILWFLPQLKKTAGHLVIDIYNVWLIETLAANNNLSAVERVTAHQTGLRVLRESLHRGDYFLCAGERQKDYWLGMLHCLGRIEPELYADDPRAESLLGVVPSGIPSRKPQHRKNVLRGVCQGIGTDDKLLIWGGSVCNWFDPLTLIRAMALLRQHRDDVRLYFMGLKAPNSQVADYIWCEADKAVSLSKELGNYGRDVFFNESWIPYDERENYLLEADLGASLHYDNLETRYAFRTRVLDYLWAELPVITSKGDCLSALVGKNNLGRVVPCKNTGEVAGAILSLLDNPAEYQRCRENISRLKNSFYWENVMVPLLEYCRNPGRSRQRM